MYLTLFISLLLIFSINQFESQIIITDEDGKYNEDRILIVFNLECAQNAKNDDNYDQIQSYIDSIKSTYSQCLSVKSSSFDGTTHYDTNQYSYVFMDLECSLYSINEQDKTLSYQDLCIEHVYYEPLFEPSQTSAVDTVPDNSKEFACMRQNTDYFESFGLDLLDSEHLDDRYAYPQFKNDTYQSNAAAKVDLHILDSGIQSDHVEFLSDQVIHIMGNGSAQYGAKFGTHGTHVAGLAAGQMYGASRNYKVYDYLVCKFNSDGSEMPCYFSSILEALFRIWYTLKEDDKRGVINLSLGGPKNPLDDPYDHLFEQIVLAGGIPVVAAGNENENACSKSPAYSSFAITVGSFDKRNTKSDFSNWGDCVDIWAPGSMIYSSISSTKIDEYEYKSGTSMASPYIAGVVANLLYINPELTFDEIKQILRTDTKSVSGCGSYDCPRVQYKCESNVYVDLPHVLSTLDIVCIVLFSLAGLCIIICIVLCVVKYFQNQREKKGHEELQNDVVSNYNENAFGVTENYQPKGYY